jgi:hypothetical protein
VNPGFSVSGDRVSRVLSALGVGVAVVAFAGVVSADGGRSDCRDYSGPFTSQTVPPPTCTSPVGLCTHGILRGSFPAIYDFTFSTLQSTNDPTDPTAFVYTGHSIVTTTRGVMHTNDNGIIHIPTDGSPAPFATTAIVASGTNAYVDTTGLFVAQGNLDFSTGNAVGSYIAHLCSDHCEDHQ